jgi:hypothetical protein
VKKFDQQNVTVVECNSRNQQISKYKSQPKPTYFSLKMKYFSAILLCASYLNAQAEFPTQQGTVSVMPAAQPVPAVQPALSYSSSAPASGLQFPNQPGFFNPFFRIMPAIDPSVFAANSGGYLEGSRLRETDTTGSTSNAVTPTLPNRKGDPKCGENMELRNGLCYPYCNEGYSPSNWPTFEWFCRKNEPCPHGFNKLATTCYNGLSVPPVTLEWGYSQAGSGKALR